MSKINTYLNILNLIRYNLKIIFGGKFILFIFAALAFFLIFGTISALDDQSMEISGVYGLLILPAALIVFYPAVFGIQKDADFHTLEIIFGIPDYRFKVWFLRLILVFFISFLLLFPFALLAHVMLISIPVFAMVLQLMVLIIFIGSFAFCLSTIIKNGNGTAVTIIVAGLIFWILGETIDYSKWNVFLNPFATPSSINEVLWAEIIFKNRVFLLSLSLGFLLLGLLNLQQREKFIR
jgi:hypothetical protein